MAISTGTITKADVVVFEPEIWEGAVNDFYRAKLIAGNFFWDLSSPENLFITGDRLNEFK